MKKLLFTFFGLIFFTSLGWGAEVTVTKTISDLITMHKWEEKTESPYNVYPNFTLDNNISVAAKGSTNGTLASTKWYTYQVDNDGEFVISAKDGCRITSITLTYSNTKNGKLYLTEKGSSTSISSGTAIPIANKQSVSFSTGATSGTSGRSQITQFSVTYDFDPYFKQSDVTIGLLNKTYRNVNLLNLTGITPEYSSSDKTVAEVDKNTGIVTPLKDGQTTTITAKMGDYSASYTLHVDKGIYYESFSPVEPYNNATSKNVTGDMFTWSFSNVRRQLSSDTLVSGQLGLYIYLNSYIQTTQAIEGGVKSIKFKWKQFGAEPSNTLKMTAQWGESSTELFSQAAESPQVDHQVTKEIGMNSNSQLKILNNSTKVGSKACRIILADIQFTPYLLFINKTPSVDCIEKQSYDLKDILIDNTGATVSYSVTAFTTGTVAPTISDAGVVDLKNVTTSGTISITASWGEVSTTTTLSAHKLPVPVITFDDASVALNGSFSPNPKVTVNGEVISPTITYTSGNENVAKVEAGKIVLKKNGVTKITAHVEGTDAYLSADKEMTLTVTAFTPAANTFFKESFYALNPRSKWETKDTLIIGDKGVYSWHVNRYQRGGDDNMVGGEAGVRYAGNVNSYLESDGVQEGGVQYILYNWRFPGTGTNYIANLQTYIINNDNDTIARRLVDTIAAGSAESVFACAERFEVKENARIRLKLLQPPSTQSVVVGPVTIIPYLLYSKRDTTITITDYLSGTFTNDKLINNTTSGSVSYAIEDAAGKADIATIENATSGAVTIHGAGTVKVIATWDGGVTTSYNLTIEKTTPTIEFSDTTIDIFGTYTPAPVAKLGENVISDAVFTYESSETKVATVEGSTFTIKRTGISEITATLVAGATYESVSAKANLTVNKPTTGAWEETFETLEPTQGYKVGTYYNVDGKDNVYHWQLRAYRYGSSEDKVNGENGISLNVEKDGKAAKNYIAFNKNNGGDYADLGGVKDIFFNWRILGNTARAEHFIVKMDGTAVDDYTSETAAVGDYYSYAKHINKKTNAVLRLEVASNADSAVFGPITIVPYLLYTTKTVDVNVADYLDGTPYINTALINNIGTEGSVTYSIKSQEPEGIAEIKDNTKGEVTIKRAGTVVVKATWSEGASTTYTLNIARMDLDPSTLTFDSVNSTIEVDMNKEPFYNKLTVPDGAGTVTYTSNKPKVATVDLNSGLVTVIGAGTATITANVADGTLYNKTSKSYTLKVSEPAGEESYTETFAIYNDNSWANSYTGEREGDKMNWNVKTARRAEGDVLADASKRATWVHREGYLQTNFEGGVKRVAFEWNKYWTPAVTIKIQVEAGDSVDNFEQSFEKGSTSRCETDLLYSHNFWVKKNGLFKIMNNSDLVESGGQEGPRMFVGDIKITPYIFYKEKYVEEPLASHKTLPIFNPMINNTGGSNIIYRSSNTSVATVVDNQVYPKMACDTAITITAIWKTSETDSVTTSYKLKINDKLQRNAKFKNDTINIAIGETIQNKLSFLQDGSEDPEEYSSSESTVAAIESNAVSVKGIGTTIIKAVINESDQYQADSATYVLIVSPAEDENHTLLETFDGVEFTSEAQQKLEGDLSQYGITWSKNNVLISRDAKYTIGGKQGTWMRQAAELFTEDKIEGGVKYFSCHWRQPSKESNTIIKLGLFLDDATDPVYATGDKRVNDDLGSGSEDQYYFACNVSEKSNAKLTIKNLSNSSNALNGRLIFDTIKVVPYLFYTRKDTTLVANEMGGVYTYTNDKLINNTEDAVAANFTYTVRAKDNAVSIADEHSGELTIIGAGTDTIEVAWDGVTTTYVVHVNLEDAGLEFAKKDSTVLLNTGSCIQTASKTTTADVKYEFEGEHDGAEISETTGEVTFTKTGTFTILATVPVALPYNLDTARYTLTVNNKPTPTVVFDPKTVDMNAAAFTPVAKTIPESGMGAVTSYESSDLTVAKIVGNKVTIVGEGKSTITIHYAEGEQFIAVDPTFDLTVTDPSEAKLQETFKQKQHTWASAASQSLDGDLFKWNAAWTRRGSKEVLANKDSAIWFKNDGTGYIETKEKIEGGIKRVSFFYNKYDNQTVNLKFMLSVDGVKVDSACQTNVAGEPRAAEDFWFNHNIGVKENAKLCIAHPINGATAHLGYINITPYIYYKATKEATIDLKTATKTCQLAPDVDNRDDKDVSTIKYAFVEDDVTCATIDETTGLVTGLAGGKVTVKAYWSTNEDVYTTYALTILPAKTVIKLMHNDGTDGYNTIENTIGAQMEAEVVIPTRTGYRFNAYFYDAAASKNTNRMTATNPSGVTSWVNAVRTYNKVTYINNRVWVYEGAECSIYANWSPERKIALDNQDETTPDTVYTAICANNDAVNLLTPVAVPVKENHIFLGYYTATEEGTLVIDENGAFKASVEGYTDNKTKWQKDVEITTLYAHWKKAIILKDNEPNKEKLTPLVDGDPINVDLVRSFTAGEYNTICLPFDISKDDLATALKTTITSLATLVVDASASLDEAEKNLSIEIEEKETVEAGKPYLIKLEKAATNPSFENVVIKCAEGSSIGETDVTFNGLLSPKSVPANKSVLFVVSNDKLAWNATGAAKNMNGMRAYFHVDGVTNVAARLVMRQPSTPTGMQNAECTMQGVRKMIINNQLIIIRNGVRYNANGAKL